MPFFELISNTVRSFFSVSICECVASKRTYSGLLVCRQWFHGIFQWCLHPHLWPLGQPCHHRGRLWSGLLELPKFMGNILGRPRYLQGGFVRFDRFPVPGMNFVCFFFFRRWIFQGFFWMNIVFIRFYLLKLYHSYDLWLFFTSFCSIHDKPHHLKFPHFRKVFQWESVWWQNQGTVLQFQDIPLIASFAIFDDPSDDKSSFWSW